MILTITQEKIKANRILDDLCNILKLSYRKFRFIIMKPNTILRCFSEVEKQANLATKQSFEDIERTPKGQGGVVIAELLPWKGNQFVV